MNADQLIQELHLRADPKRAKNSAWFFKTKEGEYGAGDMFIGVRVPIIREVCRKYKALSACELEKLLESPIHEVRLAAIILMDSNARSKSISEQHHKELFDLYLGRHDRINNWDLVDSGARNIVGKYLLDKPRDVLYKLARSPDLWERRSSIVATGPFIVQNRLDDTFKIAEMLMKDKEDLIHKAVGWLLREAGDKDISALKRFLDKHASNMPRTMLRYCLEHFDANDKKHYMSQK